MQVHPAACLTDPEVEGSPPCADGDGDSEVDLADFGRFQLAFAAMSPISRLDARTVLDGGRSYWPHLGRPFLCARRSVT